MSTTTAIIIGQVLAELLKVTQKISDLKKYRALMISTATNFYGIQNIESAENVSSIELTNIFQTKACPVPEKYTEWDNIEIKGPMTIKEMVYYIENKYKINVNGINSGKHDLYRSEERR